MSTEIEITEKTKIPLSLIGVIVIFTVWEIRLEGKVEAANTIATLQSKRIDAIEADRGEMVRVIQSIDQRLARIEGKLGVRVGNDSR